MWRWSLLLVVGCNQIYGLEETRQREPEVLPDFDQDGRVDVDDNCPDDSNANQVDSDGDGRGDVCDRCPLVADAPNANFDGDRLDDACDPHPRDGTDCLLFVDSFYDPAAFATNWTIATNDASTATPETGKLVIVPAALTSTVLVTAKGIGGIDDVIVLGTILDDTASVAAISSQQADGLHYACKLYPKGGGALEAIGPDVALSDARGLVPSTPEGNNLLMRLITSDNLMASNPIAMFCRADVGSSVGTSSTSYSHRKLSGTAAIEVAGGRIELDAIAVSRVQGTCPDTVYR